MKLKSTAIHLFAAFVLVVLSASTGFSQINPQRPPSAPPIDGGRNPDEPPLTTLEEELKAKREIKLAEKDHQENLERAREIGDIGKQLKDSVKDNALVDHDCLKKIDRLEKLTKKVRGEAGGDDQEVTIAHPPTDVASAVTQVSEAAESLSKDVQKTPRRVVSASVICNANLLLELIKVARTFVH